MRNISERGAVAVEFALLAPVIVMIVLGIVEFGRAYNVQVTMTNAAREGARVMAINNDQSAARAAARVAASHLSPPLADTNITFSAANCAVNSQIVLTISYDLNTLTGIAGPFAMTGRGSMLCGG